MAPRRTGAGKVGIYPNSGVETHGLLYNFDIDGHLLKREHKSFLDTQVIPLLSSGGHTVLTGLSSRSGTDTHNDRLSEQRVREVLAYVGRRAPTLHIFMSKSLGESAAAASGQKDGLEDELYRAVSVIVSPKPIPKKKVPPRKEKPTPYPEKEIWRKEALSLRAKILDLPFYKKVKGHLYLTYGYCNYLVWPLSVSNLSMTVGIKGKPPVWYGDMKGTGAPLFYNEKIFNPQVAWDTKKISMRMYSNKVKIVVHDGLPAPISAVYMPLRPQGISIIGRNIEFELTQDGGELGLVGGVGSIGRSVFKNGHCA